MMLSSMDIPLGRKENIVDEIQGIKVSDPYRWLENSRDPEVQEWIKQQNKKVDQELKNDSFKLFSDELTKNYKVVGLYNPVPVNGTYFYRERQPEQDQSTLYMKKGLEGTPVVLFDPNSKRKGNAVSIDYWDESHTGKYIVYGISEGGDEMATMYIKDTTTNKELAEKIIHCRNSNICWLPDDTAFFYTRNGRPGTVPKNEEHMHTKVYFHKIGDNPDQDELIFGKDRPKDDLISIRNTLDGKYLAIQVAQNWSENDVYIYDVEKKITRSLFVGIHSKLSVVFLRDKVLLYTDYKADNCRVLSTSYDKLYLPIDDWGEFIPEKSSSLEIFRVTKNKILAEYLVNACSEVVVHDYTGKEIGKIPLPPYSNISGVSSRREEEEFFYGVDSFVRANTIYRYDPVSVEYSEYRKTDSPINPNDYEVKQEWFSSKDQTKVPMFIFHKKDIKLDSANPTVLYGYGGFGMSETPAFMRNWIPWIERGGVFAIANIRGGGEFGKNWHLNGIKENKQNGFDDFIAAGEHLISKKYTNADHLGIVGGSNGGLLVSVVGVQRPDLFKAVCSRVPLTDMVRFPKFGMAIRWTHEYGNPDVKEDLERILGWSPYHNVKNDTKYPSFLFTTAEKDTRCDPLHARKMTAMLQGANTKNKALVLTEMDTGHGGGKPIVKIVESQALVLSFFTKELGL